MHRSSSSSKVCKAANEGCCCKVFGTYQLEKSAEANPEEICQEVISANSAASKLAVKGWECCAQVRKCTLAWSNASCSCQARSLRGLMGSLKSHKSQTVVMKKELTEIRGKSNIRMQILTLVSFLSDVAVAISMNSLNLSPKYWCWCTACICHASLVCNLLPSSVNQHWYTVAPLPEMCVKASNCFV